MAEPPSFTTPCLDHHPKFNTPVIIAALLCALLCALGLYSMLHCVVQCTQRTFTEPAEWVASRKMNSGLKKKELTALPTSTYVNNSTSAPNCAICLVDFTDGERIRVLPQCDHRFHVACVDKWLVSHPFCPTCRHYLKSNGCLQIVTVL